MIDRNVKYETPEPKRGKWNAKRIGRLIGALLLIWSTLCLAVEEVHYPIFMRANRDPNEAYTMALLQLALKRSGKNYRLVPGVVPMPQSRAIQEAANLNGSIDLLWSMTTAEREAQLLPIRIPIDKGLLGWRVALMRGSRANLLADLSSVTELRRLRAGQGHDWPDSMVLQDNGLSVVTSCCYDSLFLMLQAGRFDYFPRSVMEAWNDIANHPDQSLAVDSHIVIHYPTAAYFFVSPRRPQLARDLQAGLERAIADGTFEALFQKWLGPFIERAQFQHRRVIELDNFLVDKSSLPLNRSELWFQPSQDPDWAGRTASQLDSTQRKNLSRSGQTGSIHGQLHHIDSIKLGSVCMPRACK